MEIAEESSKLDQERTNVESFLFCTYTLWKKSFSALRLGTQGISFGAEQFMEMDSEESKLAYVLKKCDTLFHDIMGKGRMARLKLKKRKRAIVSQEDSLKPNADVSQLFSTYALHKETPSNSQPWLSDSLEPKDEIEIKKHRIV